MMDLDFGAIRVQSVRLSEQKAELYAIRNALSNYQNSIPSYWKGMEADAFANATQTLISKVDTLIMSITSAASGINAAATRCEIEQGTSNTESSLDTIV